MDPNQKYLDDVTELVRKGESVDVDPLVAANGIALQKVQGGSLDDVGLLRLRVSLLLLSTDDADNLLALEEAMTELLAVAREEGVQHSGSATPDPLGSLVGGALPPLTKPAPAVTTPAPAAPTPAAPATSASPSTGTTGGRPATNKGRPQAGGRGNRSRR